MRTGPPAAWPRMQNQSAGQPRQRASVPKVPGGFVTPAAAPPPCAHNSGRKNTRGRKAACPRPAGSRSRPQQRPGLGRGGRGGGTEEALGPDKGTGQTPATPQPFLPTEATEETWQGRLLCSEFELKLKIHISRPRFGLQGRLAAQRVHRAGSGSRVGHGAGQGQGQVTTQLCTWLSQGLQGRVGGSAPRASERPVWTGESGWANVLVPSNTCLSRQSCAVSSFSSTRYREEWGRV